MTQQSETLSILGELNKKNNSSDSLGDQVKAEGLVYSPWMRRNLTLIGYLPYSIQDMSGILNRPFVFTPYLLKYEQSEEPFLIYKSAACAKGNIYSLGPNLQLSSVLDNIPESYQKVIQDNAHFILGDRLNALIDKQKTRALKDFMNRFEEQGQGQYAYLGRDFEWVLSRGQVQCICRVFLCLCSYMNEVTDNISYVLLPSSDVYKVLEIDE